MKDVFIHSTESLWLEKKFGNSLVSIDELISLCEDLIIENEDLKEELDDLKQDLQENYKPILPEEQYE